MESPAASIRVRSHRQAMDWSLVLVSQGIESTIVQADDGVGWGLLVSEQDYGHALKAIRQYRLENRGWPWQQAVFKPGFLFDWGSLAWALLACLFFWLSTRTDLRSAGLMDGTAVAHGQWWRLFTAMWLHADLAHLATNATIGLVLLGLTMGRYGTGVGLLAAYLAGAGGNLAAALISLPTHRNLGASGMVMGSLGLLAVQSLSLWRTTSQAMKYILSGICGGVMLFVLLALTPGTDVIAHSGGFVCGVLLGALLSRVPDIAQRPNTNLFCGLAFALLVIAPWWLALRSTASFAASANPTGWATRLQGSLQPVSAGLQLWNPTTLAGSYDASSLLHLGRAFQAVQQVLPSHAGALSLPDRACASQYPRPGNRCAGQPVHWFQELFRLPESARLTTR